MKSSEQILEWINTYIAEQDRLLEEAEKENWGIMAAFGYRMAVAKWKELKQFIESDE